MTPFKFDIIHSAMDEKGFRLNTSGVYNLNLIAIRAEDRHEAFPDQLHVIYRNPNTNRFNQHIFDINTMTGKHWLFNPLNVWDCDILVPGHYANAFKSNGEWLQQCTPMNFVRDGYPLELYNTALYETLEDKKKNSLFILDGADLICAHSLKKALNINYYRGGLQVLKNFKDLDIVMELCLEHMRAGHGSRFGYTLLEEKDFA